MSRQGSLLMTILVAGLSVCMAATAESVPAYDSEIIVQVGEYALEVDGYSVPTAGDLNGDGLVDIFAREVGEGFRTYFNDGSGEFEEHSFIERNGLAPGRARFADIDNDGDIDAVYSSGESRSLPYGILLNDGAGILVDSGQTLATTINGRIGIGDLNNDGWVDLVFTGWIGPCQVWMNDGSGRFTDSGIRLGEGGGWSNCVVADVDNDGDNDLFVAGYDRVANALWLNQLNPTRPE